ncbi:sigma-fimbria adhesin, putative [Syntrophotalea carbinolica DSM 2380]|uniref:Sigma-fimbria adhesin, putative n=1 Tax=Syntrophotalea carbinolica (strain DSM 2380 / NBRC 103641 / GraBd1) TaxID=338963 RepID=Q3A2V6_SYNC1|nr:spore coat protein U domain-containing protein [Syntrophotalea carbinolica]ABA89301.1 sigma-fimbria adhesin, putative [Syntrophotalea carbinolica DSM 2380]
MKKIVAIALAAAFTVVAGTAMAADTADLDVTATVISSCSMTGGTLAFGNLDPTNAVEVTASSTAVTVTCTNGTAYTLSGDDGDHAVAGQKYLDNGTSTIPYSVSIPAGGTGTGAAVGVTIDGTIAANSYNTATAGTYTDTILLSVNP